MRNWEEAPATSDDGALKFGLALIALLWLLL
jgi:hypothetical protein